MLIIAKNAEKLMLKDLDRYKKDKAMQYCMLIQFSEIDADHDTAVQTFLKLLQDAPDSYNAQIYMCHDKDVFIFMSGFMQRYFAALVDNLAFELKRTDLSDTARRFELESDAAEIEALCEEKLQRFELKLQEDQEIEKARVIEETTENIISNLDTQEILELSKNRNSRDNILIMIVEDDHLSRTMVGNVLRFDYDLVITENGQDAIIRHAQTAPDVVFLDIGLPDINGHAVLECLFQIDPDAYVIMFSGRQDKANILRALEAGAQGFIGKPFTREKLYHYINKSPYVIEKNNREKRYESATA